MPSNLTFENGASDTFPLLTVTGGLGQGNYTAHSHVALAGQKTLLLTFDRSAGIKNYETYVLRLMLSHGDLQIIVEIWLRGTFWDSKMDVQAEAHFSGVHKTLGPIKDKGEEYFDIQGRVDGVAYAIANSENPEWTKYITTTLLRYRISLKRVSGLVHDDIVLKLSQDELLSSAPLILPQPPLKGEKWNLQPDFIPLLDIWGEGRITYKLTDGWVRSGFVEAYNLNIYNQSVGSGPNMGKLVPNLVPVENYDEPGKPLIKFPIKDNSVRFVTCIGSPLCEQTAREILRVLDNKIGVVILFQVDSQFIKNFEDNKGALEKKNVTLGPPFSEITMTPYIAYGFPGDDRSIYSLWEGMRFNNWDVDSTQS